VSNVKYPRFPTAGFRTRQQLIGLAIYLGIIIGGLTYPRYFLFPVGIVYVSYGILRALIHNLSDRGDDRPDPADHHLEHNA
jgi:hypothetical protein